MKKTFFLIFVMLAIVLAVHATDTTETTDYEYQNICLEPYCKCEYAVGEVNLMCTNFLSFTELNFSSTNHTFTRVTFSPKAKLQLNNDLKLDSLRLVQGGWIWFYELESIYQYANIFHDIKFFDENSGEMINNGKGLSITFINLAVNFLNYSTSPDDTIVEDKGCIYDEFDETKYVFSNLDLNSITFIACKFSINTPICPLIFKNTEINSLHFTISSGSIKFENVVAELPVTSLNITINHVFISSNPNNFLRGIDSKTFFNQLFFENLRSITIESTSINYIEENTLTSMKNLRALSLSKITYTNIEYQKTIFSDLKWLENLNNKFYYNFGNVSAINFTYLTNNIFLLGLYDFKYMLQDDQYLCLIMRNFTTNTTVLPIFSDKLNCTCSNYWLYQKYPSRQFQIDFFGLGIESLNPRNYCFNKTVTQLNADIKKCDFSNKLKSCDLPPTTPKPGQSTTESKYKCFEPYCQCSGISNLRCDNFVSFKQLKLESSTIWSSIIFNPNAPLDLNNELILNKLRFRQNATLRFINVASINPFSNIFKNLQFYNSDNELTSTTGLTISIDNSDILIQNSINSDQQKLLSNCTYNESNNMDLIFSNVELSTLEFKSSRFSADIPLCPLLFSNTQINTIRFTSARGGIKFQDIKFINDTKQSIKANISVLHVSQSLNRFIKAIDSNFLNEFIYENVNELKIDGVFISRIDSVAIEKLKNLRKLNMNYIRQAQESENIFSNTKWLENLNNRVNFDFNSQSLDEEYFKNNYFELEIRNDFTDLLDDKNLCLLSKFPQNSLVISKLAINNCSCSTLWFYRNYPNYRNFTTGISKLDECFNSTDYIEEIQKCNIDKRLRECVATTIVSEETTTKTLIFSDSTSIKNNILRIYFLISSLLYYLIHF